MKSLQTCFSGLIILLLLAGCAQAIGQPTPQLQETQAVIGTATLTLVRNAGTPTQSITPLPAPTRRTPSKDLASATPTITPLASLTLKPTSKYSRTPTPTITGTNTLYVRPPGFGGPTRSPTPVPFKCNVIDLYPDFGQTFTPRADFVALWKVFNTGANMWHADDIIFDYISGTKMHNDERVGKILTYTLYAGDHLNIQVHMKPPLTPGLYTTNLGFRKTNKKEFFCTLSVTIQVVKKQ